MEAELETTQADEVNDFIEHTCWGDDISELRGNKGTVEERRAALVQAFDREGAFPE